MLERCDVESPRARCSIDELAGDDAGQVVEEGIGCCLDVLAAAGRPLPEVHLEAIREPHCLQDCGVVPAEFLEPYLDLGDGSSQGGSSDSGPLVSLADVIHLLLKPGLDRRLQWVPLSTSPLLQTSQTAPRVEGIAWQ